MQVRRESMWELGASLPGYDKAKLMRKRSRSSPAVIRRLEPVGKAGLQELAAMHPIGCRTLVTKPASYQLPSCCAQLPVSFELRRAFPDARRCGGAA